MCNGPGATASAFSKVRFAAVEILAWRAPLSHSRSRESHGTPLVRRNPKGVDTWQSALLIALLTVLHCTVRLCSSVQGTVPVVIASFDNNVAHGKREVASCHYPAWGTGGCDCLADLQDPAFNEGLLMHIFANRAAKEGVPTPHQRSS